MRMTRVWTRLALAGLMTACAAATARAQEAPPQIGPIALDIQGTALAFPTDEGLAASRGLDPVSLPKHGLGVNVGLHVYPFHLGAVTVGLGAQVALARAHHSPPTSGTASPADTAVTEQFASLAPQVSLNFGTGNGWSYLSAGIGITAWSLLPDGNNALPPDVEHLKTINYGGGARWFIKPHLAFSFDVRFYAVNPTTPALGLPAAPRTTRLIAGAGISIK
jgi:hypothetical protein